MQTIDWIIVVAFLAVLVVGALSTRRHAQDVAGWLAARRCAGRYLISTAQNMAQLGVITLVWYFQQNYDVGFTSIWWGLMEGPALIVIALTGWVIFRFRQTRALTMAEFFERRYSRRFRIFAGLVAFLAGIINYGIFPAVAGRFFVAILGLPEVVELPAALPVWGGDGVPTFALVMAGLLAIALGFTFIGGQVAVMVTDFLQGVFCNVVFLAVVVFCLVTIPWAHYRATMLGEVWNGERVTWATALELPERVGPAGDDELLAELQGRLPGVEILALDRDAGTGALSLITAQHPRIDSGERPFAGEPVPLLDGAPAAAERAPPGSRSLVDPFELGDEERFNIWYWIISVVVLFYGMKAWQGDQGYNAAALDAHEARMANILNGWRFRVLMLVVLIVPLAIRVLMHHPAHVETAVALNGTLDQAATEAIRSEIRTPLVLAAFLPPVLLGMMVAAMLGAFISTNDTYLHSWGSIFVQDVVLPLRGRPISARAHVWLLRASIIGVGVFAFLFSLFYTPTQYIAMFVAITGAVFVGGAGAVIIGGLYWKWGTTAAAWTAMTLGMTLAIASIALKQTFILDELRALEDTVFAPLARVGLWIGETERITGQILTFVTIVVAIGSYVGISLFERFVLRRPAYDLDRLLHRGAYVIDERGDAERALDEATAERRRNETPRWLARLGFDAEYTGTDRWVALITLSWPFAWTIVFVVGTVWALVFGIPESSWATWWRWWTWGILLAGATIVAWFTIGGTRDLVRMYRLLALRGPDDRDDGTVDRETPS